MSELVSTSSLFNSLSDELLALDPVSFAEKYLTLDGKPFKLNNNGYKPFVDIYRYIGIKALEKNSKPVILVKGRQVGATTMASVLEAYFMACGLFGARGRAPIRVMHCFPTLELAFKYSKTKLNAMLSGAKEDTSPGKKKGKRKSYIESKLDPNTSSGESLQFKQFVGNNYLFVESTGLTGDRLRSLTVDCMLFDECFPFDQLIETEFEPIKIGSIYQDFIENKPLPLVRSYNEKTCVFEYKKIINVWNRGLKSLLEIKTNHQTFKCTRNHPFLTINGWVKADCLSVGNEVLILGLNETLQKATIECINYIDKAEEVYDIEVADNHNFIVTTPDRFGGPIVHNCQDMRPAALSNSVQILSKAQYGRISDGVQVYFGTPKQKGTAYWRMWNESSQQYFHLGCVKCGKDFPLYTPGGELWEKIWIDDNLPEDDPKHGFIVKCIHCDHEQDKRQSVELGKWVAYGNPDAKYVGFHINQLYMPEFSRSKIIGKKPEFHPVNTLRAYQNEVLGEFFAGDSSPITSDIIDNACADRHRAMSRRILPNEKRRVYLGLDWGQKIDLDEGEDDENRQQGQSYSCAVILSPDSQNPAILNIEYATRLTKNSMEHKKQMVQQMFRQYSVTQAVGDIGYANDLTEQLSKEYGEKFIASRASGSIKNHVKFMDDVFPQEVRFEKDYWISEIFDLLRSGKIRFPYKNFEYIAWLIEHCSSMEIKPVKEAGGDVGFRYVKGNTPNDGLMSLINAYIAYKYDITNGFSVNDPNRIKLDPAKKDPVPALIGYIPRMRY